MFFLLSTAQNPFTNQRVDPSFGSHRIPEKERRTVAA
jgi:hypothetical protein